MNADEMFKEALRRMIEDPPKPEYMAEQCEKLAKMFPERADEYLKDAAWFRRKARFH